MHAVEQSIEVDVDHIVPCIGRQDVKVTFGGVGACAGYQDIDTLVLGNNLLRGGVHCGFVRDVEHDGLCTTQSLQMGEGAGIGCGSAS